MAQHDYVIANDTAANVRADINDALSAIASNNSGATEPTTTYANQWWYDTANNLLKIRAEADDAWITVAYLDQASDTFRILDDTQVVNTSGTQTGLIGDQAQATWETGTGTTESLVSPAKIAAAITAQALTSPTITSPDIDLGSDATGDILYRDSGGSIARLGIGSTDQVLKVSSGLPAWGDAGGGGSLVYLATADASNNATIDFTAFDAANYDSYLFTLANVVPSSGGVYFAIKASSDGGSSYYAGTTYRYAYVQGSATNALGGSSSGYPYILTATTSVGSGTNEDGVNGQVWVHGAHLTKYTRVNFTLGHSGSGGAPITSAGVGEVKVAADVDGIRFQFSSGNVESGTITMYGLKNA